MAKEKTTKTVSPGKVRGAFLLPDEVVEVRLNPAERTVFMFFLDHPEGVAACDFGQYRKELRDIYAFQSCFDDFCRQEEILESLCSNSKRAFYTNISRIKHKFIAALGRRKAAPYIIRRRNSGLYKTDARIVVNPPKPP